MIGLDVAGYGGMKDEEYIFSPVYLSDETVLWVGRHPVSCELWGYTISAIPDSEMEFQPPEGSLNTRALIPF